MAKRKIAPDLAELARRMRPDESGESAPVHPAQVESGPRAAEDHLMLDPSDIVQRGPYVRQHVDEGELEQLAQSIRAQGQVDQAIGVRVEGDRLNPEYVLVYGMRRWMAARRLGLAQVPVRSYGRIPVAEALELQIAENEARAELHPVDTAVSFELLRREGKKQVEIAQVSGKSESYVSYMSKAGAAVLELDEEERARLYASREATVQTFQKLGPLSEEERVDRLRALAGKKTQSARVEQDGTADAVTRGPFQYGPTWRGKGWFFRMSYRERELEDPKFVEQAERFLEEQLTRLRAKSKELKRREKGKK